MASDFLDRIAEPIAAPPTPDMAALDRILTSDTPSWVEEFNRTASWAELLVGWTLAYTDREGVEHWVRPGKERREGTSATVNYKGLDLLYVYTTSVPWLPCERAYDKYGFLVHRDYHGDFKAAAQERKPADTSSSGVSLVASDLIPDDETTTVEVETDNRTRIEQAEMRLNSEAFWSDETDETDFLIEPFIGRGRAHALYAEAKAGKSYVVLQALASAAVPEHSSWTIPPKDPVSVLYLDYEMTESDLRERLKIFGYGPTDDYSHLHYIKASMLGADLDTLEGGLDLLRQAQRWECDLVVVDTMSRAVSGDENDADTVRRFYQHTGRILKANGIAWLRIDHAGKAKERGQRGSSSKNDDVDVVWRLDRLEDGAKLTATHTRVFWIPGEIILSNVSDDYGAITHIRSLTAGFASGTAEKAHQWLAMGIPLDATRSKAQAAGLKFDTHSFSDLKRYVRELAERDSIAAIGGVG